MKTTFFSFWVIFCCCWKNAKKSPFSQVGADGRHRKVGAVYGSYMLGFKGQTASLTYYKSSGKNFFIEKSCFLPVFAWMENRTRNRVVERRANGATWYGGSHLPYLQVHHKETSRSRHTCLQEIDGFWKISLQHLWDSCMQSQKILKKIVAHGNFFYTPVRWT